MENLYTGEITSKTTNSLRCRFCRTFLLSSDKIIASHQPNPRECGNCLYLDEDDIPCWAWLQIQIERSGWTRGRIYCPKKNCNARIGGFDFVQGVLCSCGVFTIPAIWIQDSKVDTKLVVYALDGEKMTQSNCYELATGSEKFTESYCREIAASLKSSKLQTNRMICLSITKDKQESRTKTAGKKLQTEAIKTSRSFDQLASTSKTVTIRSIPSSNKEDKINDDSKSSKSIQIRENNATYFTQTERMNLPSNKCGILKIKEPKIVVPPKFNEIEDHLTCAVCLDCFYKPYKCPCDHVFCEPCIRQLYHGRSGTLKCPVCRSSVRYIEEAGELREEIKKFHNSLNTSREAFERNTKYKNWALPPLGPLSFLKRHHSLVPPEDVKLIKLTAVLLSIVCGVILYKGLILSGLW